MTSPEEHLVHWLRAAHAMEEQAESMLQAHPANSQTGGGDGQLAGRPLPQVVQAFLARGMT